MEKSATMPTKNHKNIKTPNDLRIILSRTINMVLLDQMDSQTANSIASLSNSMLRVLQMTDLENRVAKLEERGEGTESDSYSPVVSDLQSKIKQLRN
jgi:hypothetical protein